MARTPGQKIASAVFAGVVNVLLTGLILMACLPHLGAVGLPAEHPSFWASVVIGAFAKWGVAELGLAWRSTQKTSRK